MVKAEGLNLNGEFPKVVAHTRPQNVGNWVFADIIAGITRVEHLGYIMEIPKTASFL